MNGRRDKQAHNQTNEQRKKQTPPLLEAPTGLKNSPDLLFDMRSADEIPQ